MADFKLGIALAVAAVSQKRQVVIDIRDNTKGADNAIERKELNRVIGARNNDLSRVASMLLAANGLTWSGKPTSKRGRKF